MVSAKGGLKVVRFAAHITGRVVLWLLIGLVGIVCGLTVLPILFVVDAWERFDG